METDGIRGFKVFDSNWTCTIDEKVFKYEIGCTYEENIKPIIYKQGFHFCKKAVDCFNYCNFTPENNVAEILALGKIDSDGYKFCTNKIKIVRELSWNEVLEIVNTGNYCTGLGNSGDNNNGNFNSGDNNNGNFNSGDYNGGNYNSGNYNTGNYNSGNHNSGNFNSGNFNAGERNIGNFNNGNYNVGCFNDGNYNIGNCNKAEHSNGFFNTVEPKIYLFNKLSEWTYSDWLSSEAYKLMSQIKYINWIDSDKMDKNEKKLNSNHSITKGYLKETDYIECCIIWWKSLSDCQKEVIKSIPNFDKEIFKEITGIDI